MCGADCGAACCGGEQGPKCAAVCRRPPHLAAHFKRHGRPSRLPAAPLCRQKGLQLCLSNVGGGAVAARRKAVAARAPGVRSPAAPSRRTCDAIGTICCGCSAPMRCWESSGSRLIEPCRAEWACSPVHDAGQLRSLQLTACQAEMAGMEPRPAGRSCHGAQGGRQVSACRLDTWTADRWWLGERWQSAGEAAERAAAWSRCAPLAPCKWPALAVSGERSPGCCRTALAAAAVAAPPAPWRRRLTAPDCMCCPAALQGDCRQLTPWQEVAPASGTCAAATWLTELAACSGPGARRRSSCCSQQQQPQPRCVGVRATQAARFAFFLSSALGVACARRVQQQACNGTKPASRLPWLQEASSICIPARLPVAGKKRSLLQLPHALPLRATRRCSRACPLASPTATR